MGVRIKACLASLNGDSTQYKFSDFKVNEPIPAKHFELDLPAGVDVRVIAAPGQ